jgi:hypothetical protein
MAGLVDDHTVFRWLFNFRDNDRSLIAVLLVESCEVRKWVFADNIGVKDKEWCIILSENFFCELKGASCP